MQARPTTPVLEAGAVTAALRRALGDETVVATGWEIHSVYHPIMANTGGVHRATGTAALGGGTAAWSMFLKVLVPPPASAGAGPEWRREAAGRPRPRSGSALPGGGQPP